MIKYYDQNALKIIVFFLYISIIAKKKKKKKKKNHTPCNKDSIDDGYVSHQIEY